MRLQDFDYSLPKELIAQYPIYKRDESRLLVLHRDTGRIEHRIFKDIVEYLRVEDILVLNDTEVISARLIGRKNTGGKIEILMLNSSENRQNCAGNLTNLTRLDLPDCEVLVKPQRGLKVGAIFDFDNGKLKAEVVRIEKGRVFLRFDCKADIEGLLETIGEMPLPPYIKRKVVESDKERYQTVYASKKGAVAAPTAGLHFTKELLDKISRKGVDIEYVTLHVGYGTFRPVKSEDIQEHKMEKEYFETGDRVIKNIKSKKGRVFVVGTTTCRVLETVFSKNNHSPLTIHHSPFTIDPSPYNGYTDLFIYPGYKFNVADALLTNFHLPKTTLLMLASAFCGRELLFKAYEEAIRERYRFYSYGDAMLIL